MPVDIIFTLSLAGVRDYAVKMIAIGGGNWWGISRMDRRLARYYAIATKVYRRVRRGVSSPCSPW